MPDRYERQYCEDCMRVHWVEIIGRRAQWCKGADFFPQETATHYTKSAAGGAIELHEKIRPQTPLEWQMKIDALELFKSRIEIDF